MCWLSTRAVQTALVGAYPRAPEGRGPQHQVCKKPRQPFCDRVCSRIRVFCDRAPPPPGQQNYLNYLKTAALYAEARDKGLVTEGPRRRFVNGEGEGWAGATATNRNTCHSHITNTSILGMTLRVSRSSSGHETRPSQRSLMVRVLSFWEAPEIFIMASDFFHITASQTHSVRTGSCSSVDQKPNRFDILLL